MVITSGLTPSSERDSSLFKAPRSLNEAVNCRFSNFRNTSAPASRDSVLLCRQGVRSTAPAMRAAAARMSFRDTISTGGDYEQGMDCRRIGGLRAVCGRGGADPPPGGAGNTGGGGGAKGAPDGHPIGLAAAGALAINSSLYPNM